MPDIILENVTKAWGDVYIDDAAMGALLTADMVNGQITGKAYIDWMLVESFMVKLKMMK